jgi:L-2-hydroxycarboxylate dehydrogenase (NAD+)
MSFSSWTPPNAPPRVSADRLRTFVSQACEKAGLPADDARILGELIAEADLRGTDTHGVFRLPLHVRRIKAARELDINPIF